MADAHRESLAQLLASDIAFECRTTVQWHDWTLASLRDLALSLSALSVAHYAIQVARPQQCLDEVYTQAVRTAPTAAELNDVVDCLRPAFQRLELREVSGAPLRLPGILSKY
ncbi:hypothetical protein P1P91_01015 [Halomonas piscis]|uniref:Uncharacterized protein n=1 Tax=Halomonas piscis TaxID=3031727 RepID=A0ABY9Z0V1_9GAMM|nr:MULTISPECIES: hypothetical protein [Halomonas]WNK20301.1 hypothetical protein P1P91_01015 [Halomonas piscis]